MSKKLRLKLKAARTKLGLSQSEAADLLKVPVRTLQQWEQDQQTPRGFALDALNEKLDKILAEPARKRAKS